MTVHDLLHARCLRLRDQRGLDPYVANDLYLTGALDLIAEIEAASDEDIAEVNRLYDRRHGIGQPLHPPPNPTGGTDVRSERP